MPVSKVTLHFIEGHLLIIGKQWWYHVKGRGKSWLHFLDRVSDLFKLLELLFPVDVWFVDVVVVVVLVIGFDPEKVEVILALLLEVVGISCQRERKELFTFSWHNLWSFQAPRTSFPGRRLVRRRCGGSRTCRRLRSRRGGGRPYASACGCACQWCSAR